VEESSETVWRWPSLGASPAADTDSSARSAAASGASSGDAGGTAWLVRESDSAASEADMDGQWRRKAGQEAAAAGTASSRRRHSARPGSPDSSSGGDGMVVVVARGRGPEAVQAEEGVGKREMRRCELGWRVGCECESARQEGQLLPLLLLCGVLSKKKNFPCCFWLVSGFGTLSVLCFPCIGWIGPTTKQAF
jgi:hypothetical protein